MPKTLPPSEASSIRESEARIRLLPDAVKSRIAAGEVVERPASVLKELVENALDAGATSIHVEIAGGGRDLIRITDNGHGMSPTDLELSVRRHATSKITSADELYSLLSMGFRGEALPSIGSVSHLTITSRLADSDEAWRLRVDGGEQQPLQPASGGIGTVVEATDLFYSLPARRKFLKNPGPEAAACTDALLRLALVRPDVEFALKQGKQELLHCPAWQAISNESDNVTPENKGFPGPAGPLPLEAYLDRARSALGSATAKDLVPLTATYQSLPDAADDAIPYRLYGYVTPPSKSRPNRSNIFLTVNGRPVKDRIFMTALTEAYRHLLPPKRFPAGILFLDMPGNEVDINVHPAKAEVRFRVPNIIFSLLHKAIRQAFQMGAPAAGASLEGNEDQGALPGMRPPASDHRQPGSPQPGGVTHSAARTKSSAPGSSSIDSSNSKYTQKTFDLWQGERSITIPLARSASPGNPGSYSKKGISNPSPDYISRTPTAQNASSGGAGLLAEAPETALRNPHAPDAADNSNQTRASTDATPSKNQSLSQPAKTEEASTAYPFRLLGQAGGAYIVLEDDSGVKLIDQHALHERILFETLMERARTGAPVSCQRLLMPETLELTPTQAAAFSDESAREILEELGYEATEFGPRTIAVQAVPHVLKTVRAAEILREILDSIAAVGEDHPAGKSLPGREVLFEKAVYVMCCKGAIKAGERLNDHQMTTLINEYIRRVGAHSFTCPHGRPLAVDLTWEQIEHQVGRK